MTIAAPPAVDRHGWTRATSGATPDTDRDVLVWDSADQLPSPAFYAKEEDCWFSKHDGCRFDVGVVTHWRDYQPPDGID